MFMFESTNLYQDFLCALVIKWKLTRNLDLHHYITLTLILALALTFLIPQTLILSHHETPLTPSLTLICPIFHDVPISQDLNTWCCWKSILTTISPIQNLILWWENYSFCHTFVTTPSSLELYSPLEIDSLPNPTTTDQSFLSMRYVKTHSTP